MIAGGAARLRAGEALDPHLRSKKAICLGCGK